MTQESSAGRWPSLKKKAQQRWKKLTDEDLEQIGEREQLVTALQHRYGYSRVEVEREVRDFEARVSLSDAYDYDEEDEDPRGA